MMLISKQEDEFYRFTIKDDKDLDDLIFTEEEDAVSEK